MFNNPFVRYIFFKDDFLVEVDEDTIAEFNSCPADDCPESSVLMRRGPVRPDGDNSEGDGSKERACDSLIMCIVTTLNQGLRNGGGIGDILRQPSSRVFHLPFYFASL